MQEIHLPRPFQESILNNRFYPQNLSLKTTITYRATLKPLKTRLDAAASNLFVENDTRVEVPVRDFHNDGSKDISEEFNIQNLQRRYDELTQKDWGSEDKSFGTVEKCFRSNLAAHLMFCHWSTEGWRWRALWLETILEGATFKVLVRLHGPDAAYSLSKREQVVQLQLWEDKVSECVMAMGANVNIITSICRFYNGLLDDKDVPQSLKDAYGLDIVGLSVYGRYDL
ncbi:hypothetical protein HRR78_001968 [Exophiala dermatitidis]|nr:hypothetical protein HRR78_001968 [Exophiala dermatitidis]